jgi:putative transposase
MAESFFAALKNELIYRTAFPTRESARRAIAEYIEVFYNRVTPDSATERPMKSPPITTRSN